jgi:glutathione synthase/RimK-type ligase-like ATP-grasp enzyme
VRVVIIGDQVWQIKLEGDDWLKSIHHDTADFMPPDPELVADTKQVKAAFGLEVIANDYMVGDDGTRYLLEVNHIPNVSRFPEIWQAYRDYVIEWIRAE